MGSAMVSAQILSIPWLPGVRSGSESDQCKPEPGEGGNAPWVDAPNEQGPPDSQRSQAAGFPLLRTLQAPQSRGKRSAFQSARGCALRFLYSGTSWYRREDSHPRGHELANYSSPLNLRPTLTFWPVQPLLLQPCVALFPVQSHLVILFIPRGA